MEGLEFLNYLNASKKPPFANSGACFYLHFWNSIKIFPHVCIHMCSYDCTIRINPSNHAHHITGHIIPIPNAISTFVIISIMLTSFWRFDWLD